MSFTVIEQATPRLTRSELAVPGSTPALFEKAARSAADVVFLDLEDAVAPDDKDQARRNVIAALNDIDWGGKILSVRVNGLDTHYMYRDVIDIVENCPRLDMLLIPKIGVPADVYALDMLVTQIEQAAQAGEKNRLRDPDRDRAGACQCRGHRAIEPAPGGDVLRRRRFCGLDARAHHGDRRPQPRLRCVERQG